MSQQIKALERQLRLRLFDRSSSGVALTEHGAALLPVAREAVAAAEEVLATARRLAEGRATVLRIGFQAFAYTEPVRELLAAFAAHEGDVELQLRQYEWDDPSAGVLGGEVDLAVTRLPFRGAEGLRTVQLSREPLLLAVRDGHPLSRRSAVLAAEVAALPFLESPLVTDPVFAALWYLRDVRTAFPVVSTATTVEEWLSSIAMGRGVNLVPAAFSTGLRRPGLAFVPVDGLPTSSVVLAWRPDADHAAVHRLARFAARSG